MIKPFDNFNEEKVIEQNIIDMLYIYESDTSLNEWLFNDTLTKIGLKIHKSKGLIQHMITAGKGIGNMMKFAIQGDKEKLQQTLKSIKKEDVMDFLLKLDMATLHLITGPIHMINAITGWDLEVAVNKEHKATQVISDMISSIKGKLSQIKNKTKRKKLIGFLDKIQVVL